MLLTLSACATVTPTRTPARTPAAPSGRAATPSEGPAQAITAPVTYACKAGKRFTATYPAKGDRAIVAAGGLTKALPLAPSGSGVALRQGRFRDLGQGRRRHALRLSRRAVCRLPGPLRTRDLGFLPRLFPPGRPQGGDRRFRRGRRQQGPAVRGLARDPGPPGRPRGLPAGAPMPARCWPSWPATTRSSPGRRQRGPGGAGAGQCRRQAGDVRLQHPGGDRPRRGGGGRRHRRLGLADPGHQAAQRHRGPGARGLGPGGGPAAQVPGRGARRPARPARAPGLPARRRATGEAAQAAMAGDMDRPASCSARPWPRASAARARCGSSPARALPTC
jgi:hypothetical protein